VVTADPANHSQFGIFSNDQSLIGTATIANIKVNRNTNNVRTVSPRSPEMPSSPFFAITAVSPARNIELIA
jgi:hypothetical protein